MGRAILTATLPARLPARTCTHKQVDVVPVGANGEQACAVNYFREGASFMEAPVSPVGPVRAP